MSEETDYQISRVADALASEDGSAVLQLESIALHTSEIAAALEDQDGTSSLKAIADAGMAIRDAICRPGIPCVGVDGGKIGDLTEAAIDIAVGLKLIASAIDGLADAMRGRE